jgi:hypothetical protein
MKWAKLCAAVVFVLVIVGLVVKEYQKSQVVGHGKYRFNLALINPGSGVNFVSFDPTEKSILAIIFPSDMAITSRTSGEYAISALYKLGSYKGNGGMFARQKMQGFMRVPIPGYIVSSGGLRLSLIKALFGTSETSLSKLDLIVLLYDSGRYKYKEIGKEELARANVIDNGKYKPERLQEFVGSRLFDWGIGAESIAVSIINASGENGLGSDMADFLSNLGMDVVMVRSVDDSQILADTQWQVDNKELSQKLNYIFENLFEFEEPKIEPIGGEYRSQVLIKVGSDAKDLF